MSAYSKINLLSIDNSAQSDEMEMRFARKYLDSRDLGVTLSRYKPNYVAKTGHAHKIQEEAYIVVDGTGSILLNDEVIAIAKWDIIRVAPETVRAFKAGPNGLDVVAVGGPKPEEGDGVRKEINWPTS